MRIVTAFVTAGLAVAGLSACSRDAGDYQSDAEDFIESNDEEFLGDINEALQASDDPPDEEVSFEEATCEEPENTDVGTQFACTATDNLDTVWDFDVEITDDGDQTIIRSTRRN